MACIISKATESLRRAIEFRLERPMPCSAEKLPCNPRTTSSIASVIGEDTQVYLCGSQGLKNMIVRAWAMAGMSGRIYSEHFDFRGAYGMEHVNYIFGPILDAARHVKLAVKRPLLTSS